MLVSIQLFLGLKLAPVSRFSLIKVDFLNRDYLFLLSLDRLGFVGQKFLLLLLDHKFLLLVVLVACFESLLVLTSKMLKFLLEGFILGADLLGLFVDLVVQKLRLVHLVQLR